MMVEVHQVAKLFTRNGKLLTRNGKLLSGEQCCCDQDVWCCIGECEENSSTGASSRELIESTEKRCEELGGENVGLVREISRDEAQELCDEECSGGGGPIACCWDGDCNIVDCDDPSSVGEFDCEGCEVSDFCGSCTVENRSFSVNSSQGLINSDADESCPYSPAQSLEASLSARIESAPSAFANGSARARSQGPLATSQLFQLFDEVRVGITVGPQLFGFRRWDLVARAGGIGSSPLVQQTLGISISDPADVSISARANNFVVTSVVNNLFNCRVNFRFDYELEVNVDFDDPALNDISETRSGTLEGFNETNRVCNATGGSGAFIQGVESLRLTSIQGSASTSSGSNSPNSFPVCDSSSEVPAALMNDQSSSGNNIVKIRAEVPTKSHKFVEVDDEI